MFEKLKQKFYERIEKGSIKIDVKGEEVYLKKSGFFVKDWHVIYPPLNLDDVEEAKDKHGNIDWTRVRWNKMNAIFGGKGNALKTFITGLLILGILFGVQQLISSYNAFINSPVIQNCLQSARINIG